MLVGNIVQEKITSPKRKKKIVSGIFSPSDDDGETAAQEVNSSKVIISAPFLWSIQTFDDRSADMEILKKTGENLIRELNNLRIGLLDGELSENHLRSLSDALEKSDIELQYPELQDVINDIRLRAAVELAKLEKYNLQPS